MVPIDRTDWSISFDSFDEHLCSEEIGACVFLPEEEVALLEIAIPE